MADLATLIKATKGHLEHPPPLSCPWSPHLKIFPSQVLCFGEIIPAIMSVKDMSTALKNDVLTTSLYKRVAENDMGIIGLKVLYEE